MGVGGSGKRGIRAGRNAHRLVRIYEWCSAPGFLRGSPDAWRHHHGVRSRIPPTDAATVALRRGTYGRLSGVQRQRHGHPFEPIITLDSLTVEHLEVAHDSARRAVTGRYQNKIVGATSG